MIGIVGGVGPVAGLDLFKKIIEETPVKRDQQHAPVILFSMPEQVADRTGFLSGKHEENPGFSLAELVGQLETAGATVAAIACNTIHVPRIFSVIQQELQKKHKRILLLNIVDELVSHVKKNFDDQVIGILATSVSNKAGLYQESLRRNGIRSVKPDLDWQDKLQNVISNKDYGIKAKSSPITAAAKSALFSTIEHLRSKGAQKIILGCTELPLAVKEGHYKKFGLIDPTRVMAKALLREFHARTIKKEVPEILPPAEIRFRNRRRDRVSEL